MDNKLAIEILTHQRNHAAVLSCKDRFMALDHAIKALERTVSSEDAKERMKPTHEFVANRITEEISTEAYILILSALENGVDE